MLIFSPITVGYYKVNLSIEVADRVAILGANGIGKSTLLKCLMEESFRDSGDVNWAMNADIGYFYDY